MAGIAEAGQAAAFGFLGVDGELLIGASTGMGHIIGAAADGAAGPGIDDVEDQWRVHRDVGMEAGGRLPGAITHPGDEFADGAGGREGHAAAIAGHHEAIADHAGHLHLHALQG